jgi:hypothetical protein
MGGSNGVARGTPIACSTIRPSSVVAAVANGPSSRALGASAFAGVARGLHVVGRQRAHDRGDVGSVDRELAGLTERPERRAPVDVDREVLLSPEAYVPSGPVTSVSCADHTGSDASASRTVVGSTVTSATTIRRGGARTAISRSMSSI